MTRQLLFLLSLLAISHASIAQLDYSPGYKAGTPEEMAWFSFLKGDWDITLRWTNDLSTDQKDWVVIGKSKSTFTEMYNGAFIQEKSLGFPINGGHEGFNHWSYTAIHSYDRFQKTHRTLFMDNILALADIYEGQIENNELTVSNQNTSTFNNMGTNQSPQKNKLLLKKISNREFEVLWWTIDEKDLESSDGKWQLSIHMHYTKKE